MVKQLAVGRVKFTAKESVEIRERLASDSKAAGLTWEQAIAAIDLQLDHVCRVAAHAQLVDMADSWDGDDWRAAAVRAMA